MSTGFTFSFKHSKTIQSFLTIHTNTQRLKILGKATHTSRSTHVNRRMQTYRARLQHPEASLQTTAERDLKMTSLCIPSSSTKRRLHASEAEQLPLCECDDKFKFYWLNRTQRLRMQQAGFSLGHGKSRTNTEILSEESWWFGKNVALPFNYYSCFSSQLITEYCFQCECWKMSSAAENAGDESWRCWNWNA